MIKIKLINQRIKLNLKEKYLKTIKNFHIKIIIIYVIKRLELKDTTRVNVKHYLIFILILI